jgi:hypothetical protein
MTSVMIDVPCTPTIGFDTSSAQGSVVLARRAAAHRAHSPGATPMSVEVTRVRARDSLFARLEPALAAALAECELRSQVARLCAALTGRN